MVTYVQGDATDPRGDGPKVIIHICNDRGGWGRGFVGALSRRWPEPETTYRRAYRNGEVVLGAVSDPVLVDPVRCTYVMNLVAQRGYSRPGAPALDYDALDRCLAATAPKIAALGATVHCPRIGTGLAGGRWERIEPLLEQHLGVFGVVVYDPVA